MNEIQLGIVSFAHVWQQVFDEPNKEDIEFIQNAINRDCIGSNFDVSFEYGSNLKNKVNILWCALYCVDGKCKIGNRYSVTYEKVKSFDDNVNAYIYTDDGDGEYLLETIEHEFCIINDIRIAKTITISDQESTITYRYDDSGRIESCVNHNHDDLEYTTSTYEYDSENICSTTRVLKESKANTDQETTVYAYEEAIEYAEDNKDRYYSMIIKENGTYIDELDKNTGIRKYSIKFKHSNGNICSTDIARFNAKGNLISKIFTQHDIMGRKLFVEDFSNGTIQHAVYDEMGNYLYFLEPENNG